MNCLCNETLSRKERKEAKTNQRAHMPLNCLHSRMPGHSAPCHYQGAEGAPGAEGRHATPGPGEEVLCRIKRIIIQGPLGNMLTQVVSSTFIKILEKYFWQKSIKRLGPCYHCRIDMVVLDCPFYYRRQISTYDHDNLIFPWWLRW